MKVLAGVMTSSPGPTSKARSASSIADSPVPTPIAWRLEALDRRAHDEIAARQQLPEGSLDRLVERPVLRPQIDKRHHHVAHYFFNPRPRYTTGRMMLHQSMPGRILV